MAVDIFSLRPLHLLQGLPDTVLADVAPRCTARLHPAGSLVLARHVDDHAIYFVLSGQLRVVALSPSGREVSFRDLAPGEHVGELAAIDGGPRSANVIALQESLLARLAAADLHELMQRHWPIAERMLRGLATSVRQLTDRVYEIATLTVQQRVAAELVRLALAAGQGASRVTLKPLPRHGDLAARIGSYREQVTREIANLTARGLLAKIEDGVIVEDIGRLAELVATPRPGG